MMALLGGIAISRWKIGVLYAGKTIQTTELQNKIFLTTTFDIDEGIWASGCNV
jgi:hypothetical protein